jgi:4-aminobutyrate aminotransferase-like enzyme
MEERGVRLAAAILDPALTSDGILIPPPEYLREWARIVREAGGLLVADEVQAGHGRYGSHLWSFQASDVVPDIVTMGKPMGNGHPVSAVVTRAEIAEVLTARTEVFSTFGGNPVSCTAALAVLRTLEEEGILERVSEVGAHLRGRLNELADRHELIGDVRGRGLLIGVELVRDRETREPAHEEARAVVEGMRGRGVLIGATGPQGSVLKIRPPLVFTEAQADLLVAALDDAVRDVN